MTHLAQPSVVVGEIRPLPKAPPPPCEVLPQPPSLAFMVPQLNLSPPYIIDVDEPVPKLGLYI